MAKQAVSWVELHIEKFVLGVTGALLLATVALYGVSTPNTKEVAGVTAGPAKLDGVIVRGQAQRLVDSLHGRPPTVEKVLDYAEQWQGVQGDVLAAAGVAGSTRSSRPWGRIVPLLDSLRLPDKATTDLAKVLAPGKPGVSGGRSTIYTSEYTQGELYLLDEEPPQKQPGDRLPSVAFEDVSWITVGALVDLAAQRSAFFDAGYDARYAELVLVFDAEAQRQTRLPDGRWSDWEDLTPYYPYLHWDVPQLRFKRERSGVLRLPKKQKRALDNFITLVKDYQCELRLPGFARRSAGDKWRFPVVEGADWETVEQQCPDYIKVPEAMLAGGEADAKEAEAKLKPQQRIKKWLKQAQEVASNAERSTYEELRDARKLLKKIDKDPDAKASQKRKVQKLLDEIEPYYNEARENRKKEDWQREAEERGEEDDGDEITETGPTQTLVWIHDLGVKPDGTLAGVEPGRTYRYRLRLRLLNTLAGQLDPESNPKAAEQVLLVGEWSPPSEPVTATKDKEFYIASVDAAGERAQVQVSVWREGKRLHKKFTVGIGEEIGEERVRYKMREKVEDKVREKTIFVDFRTGVTLVDIEPNRIYQRRKVRRDGFDFDPVRTQAVILASASGALEERLVYLDKQAYATLRKAIEQEKAGPKKKEPKKKKKKKGKGGFGGSGEM